MWAAGKARSGFLDFLHSNEPLGFDVEINIGSGCILASELREPGPTPESQPTAVDQDVQVPNHQAADESAVDPLHPI